MRFGDPAADGETESEAAALGRSGARPVGAIEALEDVGQIASRDADARVLDRELGSAADAMQGELDTSSARRVLDGIRRQVQQQLPQANVVPHRGARLGQRQRDRQPGVLAQNERRLEYLLYQWLERNRLAMQIEASLVGTRERQQALHQVRHARRLGQRLLQRDEAFGLGGSGVHRPLDVGAQHGQRRFELMAGIGGEAPERAERFLQARQHLVQGEGEPRHLVAGVDLRQSAMQTASVGDRLNLVDDQVDRPECPSGDRPRDQHRRDDQEGGDRQTGGHELCDRRIRRRGRRCRHHTRDRGLRGAGRQRHEQHGLPADGDDLRRAVDRRHDRRRLQCRVLIHVELTHLIRNEEATAAVIQHQQVIG